MRTSFSEDVQLHRNEQVSVDKTEDNWAVCLRTKYVKNFKIFYFIFVENMFQIGILFSKKDYLLRLL